VPSRRSWNQGRRAILGTNWAERTTKSRWCQPGRWAGSNSHMIYLHAAMEQSNPELAISTDLSPLPRQLSFCPDFRSLLSSLVPHHLLHLHAAASRLTVYPTSEVFIYPRVQIPVFAKRTHLPASTLSGCNAPPTSEVLVRRLPKFYPIRRACTYSSSHTILA